MKTASINTNLGRFAWRIEVYDRIDPELLVETRMDEMALALKSGVPFRQVGERIPKKVWDALIKGGSV